MTWDVLNLYAGIGGNRKLWEDVNVTAVEIDEDIAAVYRDKFPEDEVVVGDAHSYLRNHYDEYDFIWSSPPCPTHSQTHKTFADSDAPQNREREPKYPDMRLYQEIIFLQHFFDGRWCVENVSPYYTPLISGQDVGRHKMWANFPVPDVEIRREFNLTAGPEFTSKEELEEWLGISIDTNLYVKDTHDPRQVLRNCVHPKIGKAVLKAARDGARQQNLQEVVR